jgi:hypothetical protein
MSPSFNKRAEDFDDPANYNKYLETCEDLTFSLIHSIGSDLAATEAQIRAYELENRRSIEENEERGHEEREELERREKGEREWRERERRRVVEEMESEKKEKEDERRRVMEMLVRFPSFSTLSSFTLFRPFLLLRLLTPFFFVLSCTNPSFAPPTGKRRPRPFRDPRRLRCPHSRFRY